MLMSKEYDRYYNDDGTRFDPDLIPKPNLCITCNHDDDSSQEMLCNLTRADQREESTFRCDAYEKLSHRRD